MKQVIRRGLKEIIVDEVADPVVTSNSVLVRPFYSLISAGTEFQTVMPSRIIRASQCAGSIRRFHSRHRPRDFSVLRSASMVKPICRANVWASLPTSRWKSIA